MGWEKGRRYYTRSRKVAGQVRRTYVGCGKVAELAAKLDEIIRERKEVERKRWQEQKEETDSLDAEVARLCDLSELVAQASLIVAGFHKHRGQWRRRRA